MKEKRTKEKKTLKKLENEINKKIWRKTKIKKPRKIKNKKIKQK